MAELPAWLEEATQRQLARLRALEQSSPVLHGEVADSFHTAPGWREVSCELTCVPDPEYPWDPKIVKAIWVFDPTFVPCMMRWAFAPPNDDQERVVFKRFLVARHEPNLRQGAPEFAVEMPAMPCQGIVFKIPNVLEFPWMKPENSEHPDAPDLPGDFLPFDWPLVEYLQHRLMLTTQGPQGAELGRHMVRQERDRLQQVAVRIDEERAYRERELARYVGKKLEQASEIEVRDHLMAVEKRKSRPFVHLTGYPSRS